MTQPATFALHGNPLTLEQVSLEQIAQTYGTPCYVYSRTAIENAWRAADQAFGSHPHLVCYAVKANSNLAVLNVLARLGSGFDIVSGGELERVIAAGGAPGKVVFSGVGKTLDEIARALDLGIRCFNVESADELSRIQVVAERKNQRARISLRVNPDVDANTHPYISTGLRENKFGVAIQDAPEIYRQAAQLANLDIVGVDCHIGSQLTDDAPLLDALDKVLALVDELAADNIHISHIDIGGGIGITYASETPPTYTDYIGRVLEKIQGRNVEIMIEPGRSIVGNSGVLLTKVEYLKCTEAKNFAIVDAAMNDLVRPALYQAWQAIFPVSQRSDAPAQHYDIVGPICETGDYLGKDRELSIQTGDLLAICSAGAYGFVMSSNYNSRPRVPEVMIDGSQHFLVRERETIAQLYAGEHLLPTD